MPVRLTAVATAAATVAAGPCDIYFNANTPCVAAHSLVRALYDSYNGPLYQVRSLLLLYAASSPLVIGCVAQNWQKQGIDVAITTLGNIDERYSMKLGVHCEPGSLAIILIRSFSLCRITPSCKRYAGFPRT
jgi:hypothetical protein